MNELTDIFTSYLQNGEFSLFVLLISFAGGVISSLSPCTLGILPIVTGYVIGYDNERKSFYTFIQMLSFVLGLSVILTAIGIICALSGKVFIAIGGNYWVLFMASLIMILGLNLVGVVEIPIPVIIKKMPKTKGKSLFIYPFILGVFFALASTPCSTPILAGIMSFATLSQNIMYSALLLLAFSLGQGVIIILAGIFSSLIKNMKSINKYSGLLMKAAGGLLILSSLFIFYKIFSPFIFK